MSNEGFTIKCNKCGKVIQLANKKNKKWKFRELVINKKGIEFKTDNCNEDASIKCECGNILIF